MRIALFPNKSKPLSIELAREVSLFLKNRQVEVMAESDVHEKLEVENIFDAHRSEIDFMISFGGDGTILRLLHRYPELDVPLLGVNLGSLGFLADIPEDEIFKSLKELIEGRYFVQKRMVIDGAIAAKEKSFAVNEIVIHRAQNPCLIDLAIYVDDHYVNTFSADGIIVSTPTGSTAYSLAAGGPIVTPELEAMIITPICPHTISNKPLVLMPSCQLEIKCLSHRLPVEVSFDGTASLSLAPSEILTIRRSSKSFKLVQLAWHDYFFTLRKKLGWQGKLKQKDK